MGLKKKSSSLELLSKQSALKTWSISLARSSTPRVPMFPLTSVTSSQSLSRTLSQLSVLHAAPSLQLSKTPSTQSTPMPSPTTSHPSSLSLPLTANVLLTLSTRKFLLSHATVRQRPFSSRWSVTTTATLLRTQRVHSSKMSRPTPYNQANVITLPPCNPIKLGLALNFSVFHYEVMKNHKIACELADKALQEALDKIDELEEDDFRDAKSIIELLKENLTLWREEEDNDNANDDL